MGLTYKDSGVDIHAGYESVKQLTVEVKKTFNSQVLDNFGSFGALFQPDLRGIKTPILVSSTDGVGTKLLLAIELGIFDTIGIDLVAMCVNDLITQGAKPLFMLDYIALHKLDPELVTTIIKGIVEGCKQSACALIGGETAEMRDVYRQGDFDLAGFVVGLVDKDQVITGRGISVGDKIIRLPASGVHSNGYSLARKVAELIQDPEERLAFKKDLLIPTVIYVRQVLDLIARFPIKGIANITGGGLYENIARVLPKNVDARVDFGSWDLLPVFKTLQRVGQISWREMCSAFNVGVGMTLVVAPKTAKDICSAEPTLDVVGEIIAGSGEVLVEGLPQN